MVSVPALVALLIVRDEQERVGPCLDSLSGLVDDVLVMDTGSTDATRDIARAKGARVAEMTWPKHFARARNAALELVTAPWVLSIDADERVTAFDLDDVRRVTADPLAVAGLVSFRSAPGSTAYRELRLFRNRGDVRFAGVIHESVDAGVHRLVATAGASMGPVAVEIQHVAADDPRAKAERDLPLLLAHLADDPNDVRCWRELGVVHAVIGDLDGAFDAWQHALESSRSAHRIGGTYLLPYVDVISATLHDARPEMDADGLLDEAVARFGPVPALRLLRVERRWRAGDIEGAVDDLIALGELDARTTEPDVAVPADALGAGAWDRVGAIRLALGDTTGASAAYRRAFEIDPSSARRARRAVAEGRAARATGARA